MENFLAFKAHHPFFILEKNDLFLGVGIITYIVYFTSHVLLRLVGSGYMTTLVTCIDHKVQPLVLVKQVNKISFECAPLFINSYPHRFKTTFSLLHLLSRFSKF